MNVPPGEFVFRVIVRNGEPEFTHGACGGDANCHQFGPSPLMDQLAKQYMEFLRGNQLPGADFAQIVAKIDYYTCERLGFNRKFCYDTEKRVAETSPTVLGATGKCGSCGAPRT